jgi:eukaryotic-like serine/threonine-protein kinase
MARVFLAEERRLGRRVVVKVLTPELAAGVSADRFEREIRVAARLQDPRIVPLLTAGHAAGLPFYTMPFVEGESLRARLVRGPAPLGEAIAILRDMALALDCAHAHGLAHRDIKPENVLLAGRTAVVTDFGIAKAIAAAAGDASRETLTHAGSVLGTPAYMAPEQAIGDTVDHRADIYAWGVVAYEMLAGAHPFAAKTTARQIMSAHLTEQPAPLAGRAPAVPPALADLVDRSLAKERELRPGSTAELLRVLDGLAPVVTPGATTVRTSPPRRRPLAVMGAGAVLAIVVGLFLVRRGPAAGPPAITSAAPRSLAVLPFTSPERDSANAYFGAGMAEELTTAFARVPGLRVASGASASRLQGAGAAEAEIARQLGVQAILEGSVRRSGDRIRVTARLVEPTRGTVLWADQYDRRMAEVFDMQDEMAQAIVAALRPTLGDTARVAGARTLRGTDDLEAYDLYLKGRYYWGRRGEGGLRTAIGYFESALARDSTFARAWAGLSMAQVVLPLFTSTLSGDSLVEVATRNADHALRLDSTLADAHLARAYALKFVWRWPESEREFREALALAPEDAVVRHWYGVLLYVIGRADQSVEQLSRARELDPLSPAIRIDLMYGLYASRRYDDALAEARRSIALDSTRSDVYLQLGMLQLARGRPDSAVAAFRRADRLGIGFDMASFLSVAERRLGHMATADSLYRSLLARYRTDPSLDYAVAMAAAGAGDLDRALSAVAASVAGRSLFLTEISLTCDPMFDPLHGDPRFGRLLAKAGLQACARGGGENGQ